MSSGNGWTGDFHAGDGWAAYRGRAGDNRLHAHTAMQLVFASPGATLRALDGCVVSGTAIMARPGARHALDPVRDVLLVFLEPQSDLAAFVDRVTTPDPVAHLPDAVASLVDRAGSLTSCAAALADAVDREVERDLRLARALEFLSQAEGTGAVSRAAEHAGLSPARLRALAQAQLGAPLSGWVAWRRLLRAAEALSGGASLAAAAADAGFVDQAHLSRDMRKVLGITPATAQGVMAKPQAKRPRP
ncbi:MAG: helix-turn-helix domain-containing protein [Phenylobacterium sp.]|uniref:helix-turn-helix domain-containing protein n=1 Tax=Phenylobacterium sp. TaxID=1871053 RepID=UPI001A24EC1B|nr:helix-turn-helix domain-containing protein [Phenylobacterium sp.]MBJ7413471.1 helix-turn-helix domain-containing protein [Phenylobacterium sp.]